MPIKENIDAVNEHSEPSSEERWSESFEEGSPIIKRYDCRYLKRFSETCYVHSSKHLFAELHLGYHLPLVTSK